MLKITPVGNKAESGAKAVYRGVELLVARMNNDVYKAAFRRLIRPYQKEVENNTLDEDTSESILSEALATGILVGWNEETFPGKVKYSVANAKDLLLNDPDCRDFVTDFANDINNYLEEDEAVVVKES